MTFKNAQTNRQVLDVFADDTKFLYADKNMKVLETTFSIELQKLHD